MAQTIAQNLVQERLLRVVALARAALEFLNGHHVELQFPNFTLVMVLRRGRHGPRHLVLRERFTYDNFPFHRFARCLTKPAENLITIKYRVTMRRAPHEKVWIVRQAGRQQRYNGMRQGGVQRAASALD
jgi:hypothetical protein